MRISQPDYERYYVSQVGSGLPYFAGARVQRGSGLGSIFGGLVRSAVPLLKRVGKEVAKGGVGILGDVISGQSLKTAAKRRLQEGAQKALRAATGAVFPPPPPPPKKRRKKVAPIKRRRGAGSRQRDIFA